MSNQWSAEHPTRAWPPTLDHIYGDPFELCSRCGHERQEHRRSMLFDQKTEYCVKCSCVYFRHKRKASVEHGPSRSGILAVVSSPDLVGSG